MVGVEGAVVRLNTNVVFVTAVSRLESVRYGHKAVVNPMEKASNIVYN